MVTKDDEMNSVSDTVNAIRELFKKKVSAVKVSNNLLYSNSYK